jgi:DNA replication protein DnaC
VNVDHAQLTAMLTPLKLPAIRDPLDSLLDEAARRQLNLREALAFLGEAEGACKNPQRLQMAMSIAHFPFVRTLEGVDFEAQPALDPGQRRELATGRWRANAEATLLLGPPGVGKTHFAVALGRKVIRQGYSVLFVTATTLMTRLGLCPPR